MGKVGARPNSKHPPLPVIPLPEPSHLEAGVAASTDPDAFTLPNDPVFIPSVHGAAETLSPMATA